MAQPATAAVAVGLGVAASVVGVMVLGGVQLIMLGVVGEGVMNEGEFAARLGLVGEETERHVGKGS